MAPCQRSGRSVRTFFGISNKPSRSERAPYLKMLTVIENKPNRIQTLTRVPIFAGLSESELGFLNQRTVPRHYNAGEMVFTEGEPCTGLYVVESGQIRIFKSSAAGREQVLSIEGPGSSVAELPVFDGGNYPASVAAIEPATLLL